MSKETACFLEICREYCNKISGKDCIIGLKRKDTFVSIKVICNCEGIDPYKECKFPNELYEEFNIADYGFDLFFVTEIKAVKYSSMILPLFSNLIGCKT